MTADTQRNNFFNLKIIFQIFIPKLACINYWQIAVKAKLSTKRFSIAVNEE
jgi:hypothetical protein